MCITRGEKIDKREKIACCFSFLFFFLVLLLLLLFEHYYLLLLDFLITPFYKRYICWWSSLVLVSFKTKKIVRRHGISKILSSSPFVNSFFLFCFFLFFSFFFPFFSGNGRSVFVDHREFWYGRPTRGSLWRGVEGGNCPNMLLNTVRPCEYCRIDVVSSSVCRPYRPGI